MKFRAMTPAELIAARSILEASKPSETRDRRLARVIRMLGSSAPVIEVTPVASIKLTENETGLLKLLARCEHNSNNGAEPESAADVFTWTSADVRAKDLGLARRSIGGVFSSLVKKGLIVMSTGQGDDDTVEFTEAGFVAYRAL